MNVGVTIALPLSHALSNMSFGVIRIDGIVFVLLTVMLAAVATLAAYIPARWATKVDRCKRCDASKGAD